MTEKNITFCNKILYYLIAPIIIIKNIINTDKLHLIIPVSIKKKYTNNAGAIK